MTTRPDLLDEDALKQYVADELERSRARSVALTTAVLDDTELLAQHSRLMSPLVWDLAHIANQEELWLLREVGGHEPMRPEIDPLYDAFEHPRSERPTLPLLPPAEARAYGHEVRGRVLDLLDRALVDRHISVTEARGLAEFAREVGLGREQVVELHERYLEALAAAAMADGIVTDTERADLVQVTALLGLEEAHLDPGAEAGRGR